MVTRRLLVFVATLLAAVVGSARPVQADEGAKGVVRGVVVDSEDRPVAGATIKNIGWKETSEPVTTDEGGRFEVTVESVGRGGWIYAGCYAETADGHVGFVSVQQQKPEEMRIVVKPAQEVIVTVVDAEGEPVSAAYVEFQVGMRVWARGETDERGSYKFRAPEGTEGWTVTALKSKVGFDYATSSNGKTSSASDMPLPERVELKLDGARTVRFRAVDHNDKPVAGVQIGPWIIQKPDRSAGVNLSGTRASWVKTDEAGTAALDWVPENFGRYVSFIQNVEGYYPTSHSVALQADKPVNELTFHLLPLEKISGQVTLPDGQPAAGATVTLHGQGANDNSFRRGVRTDDDGRYELDVYSEQQYLVVASFDSLISPVRGDVVVRIGQPVTGVDLKLGPATKVQGKVIVGADGRPAKNVTVSARLDRGAITQDLPRRPGETRYYGLYIHRSAQTDADGKYELLLGPGEYQIDGPPRTASMKIEIVEGKRAGHTIDFHMPRAETGPLSGVIVNEEGESVVGAIVKGRYASNHARRFFGETKCDDGRFQIERSLDPLVIHARNADGSLAGILRSDAEASEARIVVGPVATASGAIKDLAGKLLPGKELNYGIRIYMGEDQNSSFSDSFGGTVTTDGEGKFVLTGLIPGQEYSLNLELDESSSRTVTKVTAKSAGQVNLGQLTVDPNPTPPYVPPTPAERAAKAFAVKPDVPAEDRVKVLLADAKVEYFRPLVLFGTAKDPACVELFRLFQERDAEDEKEKKPDYAAPNELRWEFDIAALDLDRPGVREYAQKLGVDLSAGSPLVILLDNSGNLSDTLTLEFKDEKLDPRRIGAWMEKHKLPTRNAAQSFAAAIAKAKAENKRVFFSFSASWCGPCRMLSRSMAPYKEQLEKHMVFVKVDISRDEQIDDLRERFPESKSSGVPWFCILDPNAADAKPLATSNVPSANPRSGNTNMGFPTKPAEVEHFMNMLKLGAPDLGEETLQEYKAALLKQ